ncbi:MAG: tetratricopeptide repeat protein [Lautropia sp.]
MDTGYSPLRSVLSITAFALLLTIGFAVSAAPPPYSVERANGYVNAKDWSGLAAYADAWTRAEPNNKIAWFYVGNNAGLQNRPDVAIAAFERVVALDPAYFPGWQALGIQLMKRKRFEPAIAAFRRATELAPAKPSHWNNLAAAYREAGRIDLALAALDSNLKLAAPNGTWVDWHNLGVAYRNLGGGIYLGRDRRDTNARALTALRRSVELNPKNHEGWNTLGAVYATIGNGSEALRSYKKAEALGNPYARKNHDELVAAMAAEAAAMRAAAASFSSSGGGSGSDCSSYSGPVNAACRQGDAEAMRRYQGHQQTREDTRRYGVQ